PKLAGTAGKLASGLVGSWLGGGAGKAAEKVGKEASRAAELSGQLGKRPRNRILVVVNIHGESCKVAFDIDGESRDDMNDEAQVVYKKIQKARDKEATITQPESASSAGSANNVGTALAAAPSSATSASAAKPFRILCAGQLL